MPSELRVDRHRQWALRLAIATSAFLVVMTLSGLSLWLLPFSIPNQILVFVHTLLGVLFFLPVSWHLLKHWLTYRGHLMTHIKLLGYIGVFSTRRTCARRTRSPPAIASSSKSPVLFELRHQTHRNVNRLTLPR